MIEIKAIRLNKFLADAGLASRRGADELIFAGRVSVNDSPVREPGYRVAPGDSVTCDGRPVAARQNSFTYILMHKPVHTVCTASDPQGRRTVLDLLSPELRQQRVVPVGRLDYMSEGLLLLTNDGETTLRLTHPRFEHPKEYEVLVREKVRDDMLQTMQQGMRLAEGEQLAPVDASAVRQHDGKFLLRLTLRQGLNRQIRRMCRDLGLTILRLKRVSLGSLQLGSMKSGTWRHLNETEVSRLKNDIRVKPEQQER